MSSAHQANSIDFRSGFVSAVVWGGTGGLAALLIVAGLQANERWNQITMLGEYGSWWDATLHKSLWPVIGCATVFDCSAWVANVSRPPRNVVGCLLQVFGGSLIMWWYLMVLEVVPRRSKGVEHPPVYLAYLGVVQAGSLS